MNVKKATLSSLEAIAMVGLVTNIAVIAYLKYDDVAHPQTFESTNFALADRSLLFMKISTITVVVAALLSMLLGSKKKKTMLLAIFPQLVVWGVWIFYLTRG